MKTQFKGSATFQLSNDGKFSHQRAKAFSQLTLFRYDTSPAKNNPKISQDEQTIKED